MKNPVAIIGLVVGLALGGTLIGMNIGVNDAGERTVIQYPNGSMRVKFDPGIYLPFFGKTTVYKDFATFDFSAPDNSCDFEQHDGLRVRYQDGGEGVVCGMTNFQLPNDEETMIALHKRFRSEEGMRIKLLNQSVPKAVNLTAALMSSEEAYATKRSEFISMARTQTEQGLYETRLEKRKVIVGIDENGKEEKQTKEVPVIVTANGSPVTQGSDLDLYGMSTTQFDLKQWDFEPKTINQIQNKREAEMAIVTSKANAKKAYWAEQQVRAEGEKAVAQAEYKAKVAAEKQIQEAERDKQLTVISAQKKAEEAKELKIAADFALDQRTAEALAAAEEAKVITTLADANAYELDAMQRAGQLFKEIEANVQIQADRSAAMAQMNVPANLTILGGGEGGQTDEALLQLMMLEKLNSLDTQARAKSGK